jgi:hypothetical protein
LYFAGLGIEWQLHPAAPPVLATVRAEPYSRAYRSNADRKVVRHWIGASHPLHEVRFHPDASDRIGEKSNLNHVIECGAWRAPFRRWYRGSISSKRWEVLEQIVSRLDTTFGDSIVAIGLYGSTAREAARDFSDIEMFCVLRNPGYDRRLEWVFGKGKAEIELFGEDVIRQRSAQLDEVWPVTHAVFANPKRI